jgi:proline iminopeptidase
MYRPLEEKVTMVYFDPRGIGRSAPIREAADMGMAAVRADFNALREHLGLERVNAIGWSNGAGNLILLAAEHPETLSAAIFVHGIASYGQEDAADFAARFPDLMARWEAFTKELEEESLTEEDRTVRVKEMWLSEFFPRMLADRDSNRNLIEEVFSAAEFSWAHGQYADQESSVFDARDQLAAIPTRSLVIAGAHDMSPPSKVQELADGLPDAAFLVFDDSGHFAPLEQPELFRTTVFDFVGAG